MKKYWVKSVKLSLIALAAVASIYSCTETDDRVGNEGLIPGSGAEPLYFYKSDEGFTIKTIEVDSISTNNFSTGYVGTIVSPEQGQINLGYAGCLLSEQYIDLYSEEEPFGVNPVIDSAYFLLANTTQFGEYDKNFTVYLYELNKPLPVLSPDSAYYSNFNIEDYINADEPLATLDAVVGEAVKIDLPKEYIDKIMSYKESEYQSYDFMYSEIKGLYVAFSKTLSGSNLMSFDYSTSGVYFHYHNQNEEPDTALYAATFRRADYDYYGNTYRTNIGFNTVTRDFSLKEPQLGLNYENGVVSEKTYVTGMAGVITELEIPKSLIETLRADVASKGGTKIAIANALLTIPNGDTSIVGTNSSLISLGAYKSYQPINNVTSYVSGYAYRDAPYVLDDFSAMVGTITTFGGYLNKSNQLYPMTITTYIQGLVNGEIDDYTIEIAPGVDAITSTALESRGSKEQVLRYSQLENSDENPIKIDIVYSVY